MSNVATMKHCNPAVEYSPIVELKTDSIGALRIAQVCHPKADVRYYLNSIRVFTRENVLTATDGSKLFHVRGIFDSESLRALPWDEIGLIFDKKIPKGFDHGYLDFESRRLTVANDRKTTEIPFQLVVEDDLGRFPDYMKVLQGMRNRATRRLAFNASFISAIADAIAWKTGKEYRDPVVQIFPDSENRAFEVKVPTPLLPYDHRIVIMPCRF